MRFFIALVTFAFLPFTALAEKRVGLIIGNDSYQQVTTLKKAVADAQSVSRALSEQGFEIITVLNAPRREMNRKISQFTSRLEPGDTAFVFYAGHGVEIDGENYLLPTDIIAPNSGERDFIKSESIALSALLDRVRATGARTTIAVIDACRDNPFEAQTGRSIGSTRGLGRITAPQGTFVIFSAGAGQLALDELDPNDPARNSVFTRNLLPLLSTPKLELREMMAGLRVDVRNLAKTVNHDQFPAYYDELLGDFYFAQEAVAPVAPVAVAPPVQSIAPAPQDFMRQDFELARSVGTPGALQAFLDRYSNRSDEFTYRMAVQLMEKSKAPAPVQSAALAPERAVVPPKPEAPESAALVAPPEAPSRSRREIVRDTQNALNAAGCSAGGADGVAGNRTRRAFQRFIKDTGAKLSAQELGTQKALDRLRAGGTCKAVVAEPDKPGSTGGINLAGNWRFTASCGILGKFTGTIKYSRTGSNKYYGTVRNSLGMTGIIRATLTGNRLSGISQQTGKKAVSYAAVISANGRSYTSRSVLCSSVGNRS